MLNTTMEKMKVEIQIPEEIIEDILVRLPVKSLLRFKCVSKSWSSLISSQEFVDIHLKFITKNHNNNFLEHNCTYCSDRSSFKDFISYSVMGSCNGLCCMMHHYDQLFLWNPATREYKQLPHLNSFRTNSLKSEYVGCRFGFGFDESHDDYKVVAMIPEGAVYSAHLYSLRTNSWTRIGDIISAYIQPFYGIFFNGRLHWLEIFGKEWRIISFDFGTEVFRFVELPMQKNYNYDPLLISVIGGCLSVAFQVECMPLGIRKDIWVMKQYGLMDSWTFVARLSFSTWQDLSHNPIHLLPNDEIVCYSEYDSQLLVYSTKDKSHTYLPIKCQQLCLDDGVGAIIQSLVSPTLGRKEGINTL